MIKAVLFDQDGVIIDSERDGHRIAYEMAFAHFGYDIKWDDEWGERTEFARGSFPLEKEGVISLTDLMGAFPQSANY